MAHVFRRRAFHQLLAAPLELQRMLARQRSKHFICVRGTLAVFSMVFAAPALLAEPKPAHAALAPALVVFASVAPAVVAPASIASPPRASASIASAPVASASLGRPTVGDSPGRWPDGTLHLPFENLDGVILVRAALRGETRDTSGLFVVDTGAGYLALDGRLADLLGISETAGATRDVGLAARPLKRLELGARQMDLVSPILTIDAEVIRNVTDREVLGLLGEAQFAGQVLRVDYPGSMLTLSHLGPSSAPRQAKSGSSPVRDRAARSARALQGLLNRGAVAVPFRRAGDGKLLVSARVSGSRGAALSRSLTLVLDTGATKTVLFRSALDERSPRHRGWKSICGVSAPTLFGHAEACIARVPRLELAGAQGNLMLHDTDAVILEGPLRKLLSGATGEPIHGLLGYSFLKHYRVTLDEPNGIAWFECEPEDWDGRANEYSHVGIQVERRVGSVSVVGVLAGSPAAYAGIAVGDEVVRLDGHDAAGMDILDLTRRMEGDPGTVLSLVIRRGNHEYDHRLVRRRLL